MALGKGNIPCTGLFSSVKMDRQVAYRGEMQCDYLYLIDYEKQVTAFEHNPFVIEYQRDGRKREHTPAFLVTEAGLPVVVDIIYQAAVGSERTKRLEQSLTEWCHSNGYTYRAVPSGDIYAGHRLANVKLLSGHTLIDPGPDFRARLYSVLSKEPSGMTVQALATALNPGDMREAIGGICHMAFHHEVEMAVDAAPIGLKTIVSIGDVPEGAQQEGNT